MTTPARRALRPGARADAPGSSRRGPIHRAPIHRAPVLALLAACLAATAVCASGSAAGSSSTKTRQLTYYSVAIEEQFVNNSDDRQRGRGNNPFGNYKDTTATTKELGNGPFPGDEALFEFNVFSSPDLKKGTGSAVFTCEYNFHKNAFCEATYQLDGGSLLGAGAFNFNSSTFTLPITGGTGKYLGARGQVTSSPGPNRSQHLAFVLV